ncbi:MAG: amidohydrolase family protein [Proteobacteria bacterium]|nr:amidohydrolase family protein [Pseudomonadota bacterium]
MSNLAKYLMPFLFAASAISLAHAENLAIVGGDVYTAHDGAVYEGGVVVITDDKIAAVGGADTPVPDGYRVIDATGKWVTPGMMNAYTLIGLSEVSLEPSTLNHSISETFYSAGFDVSYGLNPDTPIIPITRIEGVTRAVVVPGFGVPFDQNPNKSVFAGQAAVIHLGGGYDLVVKGQAAVVSYPANAKVGGTRTAVLDYLKGALHEATPPKGKKKKKSNGGGRFAKAPEDKAALARVVTGEVPLYINENKASNILQLLALRDEFPDIRLIILGAAEGWIVADELAAANVPVVIAPTSNLPGSGFDSLGATLYNAGRLEAAGVTVAIVNGGFSSAHNARLLNQDAGNAVAHGMSWNGAFEAITINPAKIFGIDEDFGSLEAGKDADVVVWDGDPLEVMSSPDHVFIMGKEVPLVSRQTRLRDRYMDLDDNEMPFAYKK